MLDARFREWVRTALHQSGSGLSSYVSNANQLETRFDISAMTLPELRDLKREVDGAPERTGRDFVLQRDGVRHELHPNVRVMLTNYIRYREETGTRPARSTAEPLATKTLTNGDPDRDYRRLTSRKAVMSAMAELKPLTEAQVRDLYRFGPARTFVVREGPYALPSKAVVGVAFRYQHPEIGPLTPNDFSGGKMQAGRHLSRLGFDVDGIARAPDDWTLREVEYIVGAYFGMWQAKAHGRYRRKDHLADAEAVLGPRRSPGSIGRKLSNISAILEDLGLPVLEGFPRLGNKQTLLTAVVTDWLADHPDVFDDAPAALSTDAAAPSSNVEVPPPGGLKLGRVRRERRGVKVDFAARDARNRALGQAGEAWALDMLKSELIANGRHDLADQTCWESQTIGDGLGYDIRTFASDGRPRHVEVKTTNQGINAPFVLSANELAASQEFGDTYVLLRVFAFSTGRQFYRLTGDLSTICDLRPLSYSAVPRESG